MSSASKHTSIIIGLVSALVLALIGYWLYTNIEAYDIESEKTFDNEAYQQEYLALQRHFAHYDINVEVTDSISTLFSSDAITGIQPKQNDVMVFIESEIVLPQSSADAILAWVNKGGKLAIGLSSAGFYSEFENNNLLKTLGVEKSYYDDYEDEESNEESSSAETIEKELVENAQEEDDSFIDNNERWYADSLTRIESDKYGELLINFENTIYINADKFEPVFSAGIQKDEGKVERPTMMQLAYGDGLITLMTDTYIWNNFQLDDLDNVFLAHELFAGAESVFVVNVVGNEWWYNLIAIYSPAFYWVLIACVILVCWHASIRFGAIKKTDSVIRTFFSQHIQAAGEYYWANQQRQKLINDVRQQVIDQITQHITAPNPSEDQLIDALCKVSMWPRDTIITLVMAEPKGEASLNETQFVALIQGLQQLRKLI